MLLFIIIDERMESVNFLEAPILWRWFWGEAMKSTNYYYSANILSVNRLADFPMKIKENITHW